MVNGLCTSIRAFELLPLRTRRAIRGEITNGYKSNLLACCVSCRRRHKGDPFHTEYLKPISLGPGAAQLYKHEPFILLMFFLISLTHSSST
jgi:hypothetical protein